MKMRRRNRSRGRLRFRSSLSTGRRGVPSNRRPPSQNTPASCRFQDRPIRQQQCPCEREARCEIRENGKIPHGNVESSRWLSPSSQARSTLSHCQLRMPPEPAAPTRCADETSTKPGLKTSSAPASKLRELSIAHRQIGRRSVARSTTKNHFCPRMGGMNIRTQKQLALQHDRLRPMEPRYRCCKEHRSESMSEGVP